MRLEKTEKGRAELQAGVRTLAQRERTMLIMVDGKKSVRDIDNLFQGDAYSVAKKLIDEGYLVKVDESGTATPPPQPVSSPAPTQAAVPKGPNDTQSFSVTTAFMAATAAAAASPPSGTKGASDQFEGKRSLATTRMFLFDICERMFARRSPDQANHFRELLRGAKDRDSMLAAAREMIDAVEQIAGHERADSITERIAMLLPSEE